jgi:hypothetical protein
LTAKDCSGGQFFVQTRLVDDMVLSEALAITVKLGIEAAERRAAIAGDESAGMQSPTAIGTVLIERQTDERLRTAQVDQPRLALIFISQREIFSPALRVRLRPLGGL